MLQMSERLNAGRNGFVDYADLVVQKWTVLTLILPFSVCTSVPLAGNLEYCQWS